ncbi:hypothetical protein OG339_03430 [Streptosporangium sp. NBC_01495]|uniref:hypothetical protein n=1 Tax=Streptosporangium sp. NBC_01495 TaxID=2903899 RepID=UPI002E311A68|nr:hypothetical protein [Streptosporangium sp. NBC_01495]
MNFCLSDLVPPLRWSDAATIPLLREQPDLPDAWWRSLPMARVLAVLGPERLADILASVALNHWPAAAVGDVLPALHVLDPDDADEPYTAIALDRAGSWPALLSLTGHDLRDQPFIQPVPLLHALFTAVFTRLAAPAPAHSVPPPAHAAEASRAPASSPEPVASLVPVASGSTASESAAGDLPVPDAPPAVADLHAGDAPGPEPEALAEPVVLPKRKALRERDAVPVPDARRATDGGSEEPPGSLFQPASARKNRPASSSAREVREVREDRLATTPEKADAAGSGHRDIPVAGVRAEGAPGLLPRPVPWTDQAEPAEAEPASEAGHAGAEDVPKAGPAGAGAVQEAGAEPALEAGPAEALPGAGAEPVEAGPAISEAGPAEAEPVFEAGPGEAEPADEAGPVEAGAEPVANPRDDSGDDRGHDPAPADAPEPVAESDEDDEDDEAGPPVPKSLHSLVDGVFANVEDKRWAVAQNRLFSDAPATVEALAKLFAVSPEVIRDLETDLRRELAEWLSSDEAAPYREHLEEMKGILGKAAPRERLVDAAEWHTRELHSLDVPAWQFVLATLPGYHLVDEWLVEGDITELRHRTRDMISGAKPPLTINKALDMVSSLGIHPEVSKEWLENVPQLRILGAGERPPQRSNGAPALTAEKPADGVGGPQNGGEAGQEPKKAPFRPLKDVSLTRRCFRQPDGRWWLRIDVTGEHLGGAECPLPSGFAAYLGMSPGDGRTVSSAVGELVLSWHDRPVLESLMTLLEDVGAKEGSHLFLTLSDEGVLRARHLPAAGEEVEITARALRLVGYTATGGTAEQARRVIATRVGMTGPVGTPELLTRLRERGDRDLLSLLA